MNINNIKTNMVFRVLCYTLYLTLLVVCPHHVNALTMDEIITNGLQNMRDEGFNTYLPSPGGLWVNWIYTNTPPVSSNMGNLNIYGVPDSSPTNRHDRLTDIVYLAALCDYKALHPTDTQFDAEIALYTNICLLSPNDHFGTNPDKRGWVYFVLQDIIANPACPSFVGVDDAQANAFYKQYTNNLNVYPGVTPLYLDFSSDPTGVYTTATEMEDACVLIVNGKKRNLTNYIAAGEALLSFQKANSWSTNLSLWVRKMGHVFTDSSHSVITPPGSETINLGEIEPGELGEMTEALLWAEQADPQKGYKTWARTVLDKLQPAQNTYKLWDSVYGGYYARLTFSGSSNIDNNLTYTTNNAYKEVGRQSIVIRSFLVANQLGYASYSSNVLATVVGSCTDSYYAAGHGWLYQMNPNWTLWTHDLASGQNWVTSEATGHALRSLLSYELATGVGGGTGSVADVDVGSPPIAGSVSVSNGVWTVKGCGADIWNHSDQFNYAYDTNSGDTTIYGRVASFSTTNVSAKAGLMIRETTNANSMHVMLVVENTKGINMGYRASTGGSTVKAANPTGTAPIWLKLVRSSNTFTGYTSSDGVNWTFVTNVTVNMSTNSNEGLVVTSHNTSQLDTATFDNVYTIP